MKLTGIELRNFRSIGNTSVVLSPWRKCNILVGQNNAGKSNVLKAIQRISDWYRKDNKQGLTNLDLYMRLEGAPFSFRLYFEADSPEEQVAHLSGTSSFHFDLSWQPGQLPQVNDHTFAHFEDFDQTNALLNHFSSQRWSRRLSKDEIRQEFLRLGGSIFGQFISLIPPVYVIPEFRQIRSASEAGYSLDGANLIQQLARYQHPEIGSDQDQEIFYRIENFVRQLLHLPEAMLEVSRDNPTVIIKDKNLRLPLSSYGTGVHELVILVTQDLRKVGL